MYDPRGYRSVCHMKHGGNPPLACRAIARALIHHPAGRSSIGTAFGVLAGYPPFRRRTIPHSYPTRHVHVTPEWRPVRHAWSEAQLPGLG